MELEELVSDVVDITDPACMEKIEIYLEELQTGDDDFMETIIDKVKDAEVTWPQPWYQRTCSLTRPIDSQGENGSETFHTDSFNKEESERIAKNWKKFRKMFDVPDKPESFARWRNRKRSRNPRNNFEKARQFVTAFLAKGLKRNLYQVYTYFVAQYAAPVKGPYSQIEEKIMDMCFYHKPNKAVPILSVILGREPRGISKRLKKGQFKRRQSACNVMGQNEESDETGNEDKPEKKKLRWKLPVATKFIQSLMKHSERSLEELKDARLDTSVWLKVQEDMEQDYRYLQMFWYTCLHVQLFVKYDVKLQKLRKKVLKRLKSLYSIWTDIRWKEVSKSYPGLTHGFLYQKVVTLVRKYPGNYKKDHLPNVIKFALKKLKNIKEKYGEKRLRTLTLDEEGNLKIVRYDEEMPYIQ